MYNSTPSGQTYLYGFVNLEGTVVPVFLSRLSRDQASTEYVNVLVVFFSLALALVVGSTNLLFADPVFGQTTLSDTVLWVGLVPILAFLQLASAILLLRFLGRWYAARNLVVLALAYVFYSALVPLMTSLVAFLLVQSVNFDTAFFIIHLSANFALYLVCLAMTQVRPRVTGPFY
jgi:hypothetical protein